jgi:hypothetical protein
MRNKFGAQFSKDFSIFRPEESFLSGFYESINKEEWGYFGQKLAFGFDLRAQTTRSHKSPDAVRKYYPMQASVYMYAEPLPWLNILGDANFGKQVFKGQEGGSVSAIFKPDKAYPYIRIGYFQPSIGYKVCDMTALDRRIAAQLGTETLIAPYYAEFGGELIYENFDWMTANFGVFDDRNLNNLSMFGESAYLLDSAHRHPSYTMRVVFWPENGIDWFPPAFMGSSLMINNDFNYLTAFVNFNLLDDISFFLQYARSEKRGIRETNNFIGDINYSPYTGIFIGLRLEQGKTHLTPDSLTNITFKTDQAVAYARIIPVPYIEFIPEYRFMGTAEYESTRWAFQLHLYY